MRKKKILLFLTTMLTVFFTCCGSCCSNKYRLTLYQNGIVVKEFDEVSNLYSEAGYTTFFYQGKKHKIRIDYIAEPLEQKEQK